MCGAVRLVSSKSAEYKLLTKSDHRGSWNMNNQTWLKNMFFLFSPTKFLLYNLKSSTVFRSAPKWRCRITCTGVQGNFVRMHEVLKGNPAQVDEFRVVQAEFSPMCFSVRNWVLTLGCGWDGDNCYGSRLEPSHCSGHQMKHASISAPAP